MTAIDRLRETNRYSLKLSNGIPVTYRLPYLEELIVARVLPLSILDEVRARIEEAKRRKEEGATDAEVEAAMTEASTAVETSMEERLAKYEARFEASQRVVALMVTELDGEPVEMTPDDTRELPPDDFRELAAMGLRERDPRAEGEA